MSTGLADLRTRAESRFAATGYPGTGPGLSPALREDWRFTPLERLSKADFQPATNAGDDGAARELLLMAGLSGRGLVFVDGVLSPGLSKARADVRPLLEALDEPRVSALLGRLTDSALQPIAAENLARFQGGAWVDIAGSQGEPVWLIHVATQAERASYLRHLVTAAAGARGMVIEAFVGPAAGAYYTNAVTEMRAEDGATVEHVRLQLEGAEAVHLGNLQSELGAGARLRSFSVAAGGRLSRFDVGVRLAGQGAECALHGLYAGDQTALVDHHTHVEHRVPRCVSRQLYKGILRGSSRGVFSGKVRIAQDAQQSEVRQTNKNLLLSERASAMSKPELEILADDVKASHGSATGQLDPVALFYLRSRGIGVAEAHEILTRAFADEVLAELPVPELRALAARAVGVA